MSSEQTKDGAKRHLQDITSELNLSERADSEGLTKIVLSLILAFRLMPQPRAGGQYNYGDQEVGRRRTTLESTSHINILELQAAFFALKSFSKETIKDNVQL